MDFDLKVTKEQARAINMLPYYASDVKEAIRFIKSQGLPSMAGQLKTAHEFMQELSALETATDEISEIPDEE